MIASWNHESLDEDVQSKKQNNGACKTPSHKFKIRTLPLLHAHLFTWSAVHYIVRNLIRDELKPFVNLWLQPRQIVKVNAA